MLPVLSTVAGKELSHCGVRYSCVFGFFHLNRNINAVTCCRPGTEHALPVGGCIDWIFLLKKVCIYLAVLSWSIKAGISFHRGLGVLV